MAFKDEFVDAITCTQRVVPVDGGDAKRTISVSGLLFNGVMAIGGFFSGSALYATLEDRKKKDRMEA